MTQARPNLGETLTCIHLLLSATAVLALGVKALAVLGFPFLWLEALAFLLLERCLAVILPTTVVATLGVVQELPFAVMACLNSVVVGYGLAWLVQRRRRRQSTSSQAQ